MTSAGVRRFYDNIELMLGYRINYWLMVCWTIITPLLTAVSMQIRYLVFHPFMLHFIRIRKVRTVMYG
jgi:Sodium:neurotransmitter symporter family